jgi:hypothetical protein
MKTKMLPNLHSDSGITAALWLVVWFVENETNLSLTLKNWNIDQNLIIIIV